MKVEEYRVLIQGEVNLVPLLVLGIGDKYYPFERTARSAHSVYDEVKDKLDSLISLEREEYEDDIAPYFVSKWEVQ